jgi:hypothetical protein
MIIQFIDTRPPEAIRCCETLIAVVESHMVVPEWVPAERVPEWVRARYEETAVVRADLARIIMDYPPRMIISKEDA